MGAVDAKVLAKARQHQVEQDLEAAMKVMDKLRFRIAARRTDRTARGRTRAAVARMILDDGHAAPRNLVLGLGAVELRTDSPMTVCVIGLTCRLKFWWSSSSCRSLGSAADLLELQKIDPVRQLA